MTIRANIPPIPGAGDLWALARFIDNRKECEKWMAQIAEATQKHLDAVALHGKAQDIERIHGEAEDWERRAKDMFDQRQAKLEADEKAFKAAQVEARKTREDHENKQREAHEAKIGEVKARKKAVGEREDEVQVRETNAANKERAAAKMRDAGKAMKDEYDAKMKAIQGIAAK